MAEQDELHQSHNKLFIAAFKRVDTVRDYLINFFPKHLTAQMNLEALELDNTNYISRKMKEYFSDIVYKTTWKVASNKKNKRPRDIAIALLFEHKKGHPRYAIHFQFLEYMIGIWGEDIVNKRRLTVVIPILIHQGKRKWIKRPFQYFFKDLPEDLRGFIPDFDYYLTSAQSVEDDKIFSMDDNSLLRSLMLTYKHLENNQFVEARFEDFFKFFEKNPQLEQLFNIFFEYFLENSELNDATLHSLLDEYLSSLLKENTMSTYQQIKLAGKQEGLFIANKATAKRLWAKGQNGVQIAELIDRPIEVVKEWLLEFEKEAKGDN